MIFASRIEWENLDCSKKPHCLNELGIRMNASGAFKPPRQDRQPSAQRFFDGDGTHRHVGWIELLQLVKYREIASIVERDMVGVEKVHRHLAARPRANSASNSAKSGSSEDRPCPVNQGFSSGSD